MGQFMSSNRTYSCNDELTNVLVKTEMILTKDAEKIFRCVDRGFYFPDEDKALAYRDTAWLSDPYHLSAPSVYATVLECLELRKGNKFLNVGSGIGYFNTLVGLLLGANGVNHGIDINSIIIDRANQKMEEFKLKCAAIDYYHFCEPIFINGNACELLSMGFYDKVYCGAGVPPEETHFLKSLVKIGGIIVMPLDGYLLKIIRQNEFNFETIEVLEVTFSKLIVPTPCSFNTVKFPNVEPLTLQELCRSSIRSYLRKHLENNFPELAIPTKCKVNAVEYKGVDEDSCSDDFTHFQYHSGLLRNIVNLVDTFASMDNGILSDTSSDTSDEASENFEIEEENENNGNSDDNNETKDDIHQGSLNNLMTETSDEPSKRKLLGAVSSEQNKLLTEKENPKRMKMGSSSAITTEISSSAITTESSSCRNELLGEASNTSRFQSLHDDAAANDNNANAENMISSRVDAQRYNENINAVGNLYHTLFDNDSNDSENSATSEDARDLITYKFVSEYKDNEFSILLKASINSLPIPAPLKCFLNYNRVD